MSSHSYCGRANDNPIAPVTDLAMKRLIENGMQAGPDLALTGPIQTAQ
ncbi:MAG: hypothetical protein ACRYFU_10855 [Janthinobacterium lividum]